MVDLEEVGGCVRSGGLRLLPQNYQPPQGLGRKKMGSVDQHDVHLKRLLLAGEVAVEVLVVVGWERNRWEFRDFGDGSLIWETRAFDRRPQVQERVKGLPLAHRRDPSGDLWGR